MATATKEHSEKIVYKSKIDLSEDIRSKIVGILNQQLADNANLYSQTKQAHWNVKGMDFFQLHLLFDQVAEMIEGYTDTIAERTTALGGIALGTNTMSAENTTLPEYPADIAKGKEHLQEVIKRWAAYAASTREAIERSSELGDPTTEDMFTEISRHVDKGLYFLESHVEI